MLDFIKNLITPNTVATGARYVVTAGLTVLATKGYITASSVEAVAGAAGAFAVAVWGMVLSSPSFLVARTAALPSVAKVVTSDGVSHT